VRPAKGAPPALLGRGVGGRAVQRGQLDSPQALCHAVQVQGDGAGAGAAAAQRDSAAERACAGRIACVLRRQRFLCAGHDTQHGESRRFHSDYCRHNTQKVLYLRNGT